jgi:hypothetical protein
MKATLKKITPFEPVGGCNFYYLVTVDGTSEMRHFWPNDYYKSDDQEVAALEAAKAWARKIEGLDTVSPIVEEIDFR